MNKTVDIRLPQKLSPITIVITVFQLLKALWPFFLIMAINFFNSDGVKVEKLLKLGAYILVPIVVLIMVRLNQVLQYFTTTFFINSNHEFIYRTGLLTKKNIVIPIQKIQSFQSSQQILNRLSNTYKVAVETAGSKQAEVVLLAVSSEQIEALKSSLSVQEKVINTVSTTVELSIKKDEIKLSIIDFLRLCISENHLKTIGIVAAFVFSKFNEVKEFFGVDAEHWISKQFNNHSQGISAIIIVVILSLLITILISSVRLVLKYFDFKVSIDINKIFMQWGLISTQQKTIYYKKIQLLNWQSNTFRRLLKLSILRIYAMGEDEKKQENHISIPITNENQIKQIAQHYQSNTTFDESGLGIHPSYVLRYTILIGLPVTIAIATFLFFIEKYLAFASLAWLAYFVIDKIVFRKRFRLWVNKDCMQIKKGVWGTEKILLNWSNIQSVALRTSPYQRNHDLRDIIFYTAAKPVVIPYLPLTQAQFINDYALYAMEINDAQ